MGDRNLNRALHTVAITRLRCHEDSRNYETRRSAEGKTHRDVRRSLKRILARRFYPSFKPPPSPPTRRTRSARRLDKHRSVERAATPVLPERHRPQQTQPR
jgi:hypothetical protein